MQRVTEIVVLSLRITNRGSADELIHIDNCYTFLFCKKALEFYALETYFANGKAYFWRTCVCKTLTITVLNAII